MKSVQVFVREIIARAAALQNRSVGPLVLCLIMCVLLVGCASDSTLADQSTNAPAPTQGGETNEENPASPDSLPGSEEFGLTKEELVRSIEAVESLIASCMSEAGFEYIAVDYNTVRRITSYNVCYTKLLRSNLSSPSHPRL